MLKICGYLRLAEDVGLVDDLDNIVASIDKYIDRMIIISGGDRKSCRYREVLTMRYGLDGECQHTRQEIGVYMGVSYERIRQRELNAMRVLQWLIWGVYS